MFVRQVYPDKTHSLGGQKTQAHLYRTITNFLKRTCWDGGQPRQEVEDEDTT